jgi:predicted DNA-binding transcriptional regulator AlpA
VSINMNDLDPSLNSRQVCEHMGRSLPTLNRDVREGKFPPPDYTVGQYRFWKLSTVIRARERRIGEAAAKAGTVRKQQLEAAARARAAKRKTENAEA